MKKIIKTIRIIVSILFLFFFVYTIYYINFAKDPSQNPSQGNLSDLLMPLSLFFSFFILVLKKLEDKEKKAPISDEDLEKYKNL